IAAAHVTLWPVPETLALRAAEIVGTHRIRGCDAVYVALAEQLGEPLVTLDNEQLARGGSLVVTLRPGEPTDPRGSRPG
ncbi:MAG: PIN domain-containing protein, partial [Ardenticatenales bacterium]